MTVITAMIWNGMRKDEKDGLAPESIQIQSEV